MSLAIAHIVAVTAATFAFLGQVSKRDFIKVSAIEVQLSSGAIAITSFHFSRAWGELGN